MIAKRNTNNGRLEPHVRISNRDCYAIFHIYIQIKNIDENYHFKAPISSLTIPKPKRRKIQKEMVALEKNETSITYKKIGLDILHTTKTWKKSTIQQRKCHNSIINLKFNL